MFKYTDRQKGFTIIEILIVIAIIGILATIALPKFNGVREDANIAVSKSNLKALETAIERYQLDNGSFPTDLAVLVSQGYVKQKTCIISGTTATYKYGSNSTDFVVYDAENDLYTTSDGLTSGFASYSGGITPTAQTIT